MMNIPMRMIMQSRARRAQTQNVRLLESRILGRASKMLMHATKVRQRRVPKKAPMRPTRPEKKGMAVEESVCQYGGKREKGGRKDEPLAIT
jgi:hypothetical protein